MHVLIIKLFIVKGGDNRAYRKEVVVACQITWDVTTISRKPEVLIFHKLSMTGSR